MAALRRTFRVFVSSTLADLVAERNALQAHAFPGLLDFCRRRKGRCRAAPVRASTATHVAAAGWVTSPSRPAAWTVSTRGAGTCGRAAGILLGGLPGWSNDRSAH